MEVVLILIGALLVIAGIAGCVLPVLPGPPLGFAGLILLWWARDWQAASFGATEVAVLGILALAVTALDLVLPVWGAKRYGASRAGLWGSVLGMLAGMLWFPPFGMLAGAFVGALAGEFLVGKRETEAAKAAWGVFVGTMAGVGLKLAVSIAIGVFYVLELF